jgi:hypothetical protein
MKDSKKVGAGVVGQVRRFRARFVQQGGTALGAVLTEQALERAGSARGSAEQPEHRPLLQGQATFSLGADQTARA